MLLTIITEFESNLKIPQPQPLLVHFLATRRRHIAEGRPRLDPLEYVNAHQSSTPCRTVQLLRKIQDGRRASQVRATSLFR